MSTATLSNLRDYLYGTLTPDNMLWLATQLTEHAKKKEQEQSLKPYTMEELRARIAQAEHDSAAGKGQDFDDFMHELEQEFAEEDMKEMEMLEAV